MLTDLEREIVKRLQDGLPLVPEPFAALAAELGIGEEELLAAVEDLQRRGVMRRLGAALQHLRVGYTANAMVAWRVPDARMPEVAAVFAGFHEVTHCYERKTAPGWPYNLYTVIHRPERNECLAIIERMQQAAGIDDYVVLFSTAELKRTSMRYFCD
ncbi:MAG: Lrp/AsnC family transcriptional regulator [Bacillota bacterium]